MMLNRKLIVGRLESQKHHRIFKQFVFKEDCNINLNAVKKTNYHDLHKKNTNFGT